MDCELQLEIVNMFVWCIGGRNANTRYKETKN